MIDNYAHKMHMSSTALNDITFLKGLRPEASLREIAAPRDHNLSSQLNAVQQSASRASIPGVGAEDSIDSFLQTQIEARYSELEGLRSLQSKSRARHAQAATLPTLALVQADAYALARALDARPMDDAERDFLVKAQRVASQTRTILCWGRLNVRADAEAAPERYTRGVVYKSLTEELEHRTPIEELVLARALCGSVCNGFAAVAAFEYLRSAGPEETIRVCGGNEHNWVEIHRKGKPTIVIDAWSESPVHYLEDSSLDQPHVVRLELSKANETELLKRVSAFEAQFQHMYNRWFLDGFKKVMGLKVLFEDVVCAPERREDEHVTDWVNRHVAKVAAVGLGLTHDTYEGRATVDQCFANRISEAGLTPWMRELLTRAHSAAFVEGDEATSRRAWKIAVTLSVAPQSVEFYDRS